MSTPSMFSLIFLKYLKINNFSEGLKTGKNIVLDIDQTLLRTFTGEDVDTLSTCKELRTGDFSNIIYRIPERLKNGKIGTFAIGVKRPDLWAFLYFCNIYFDKVCIWTAGTEDYARKIISTIYGKLPRPYLVYARSECENINIDGETCYYKPLDKMYQDPKLSLFLSPENTFIIDDTPNTFIENIDNAIHIPAYDIRPIVQDVKKIDYTFLMLMCYFLDPNVINSDDVRLLKKPDLFLNYQ